MLSYKGCVCLSLSARVGLCLPTWGVILLVEYIEWPNYECELLIGEKI